MKYNAKTGRVKLEAGEIRIGNFFFKDEAPGDDFGHIKVSDLNSTITHRVMKRMPVGIWMLHHIGKVKEGSGDSEATLQTFVAVMWSVFSVVPDDAFIQDMIDATKENFERHPEWYGGKPALAKRDDEGDLAAVRDMKAFEADVADAAKEGE